MACRQFDDATIQAKFFDTKILAFVQKLDNRMDKYYNNKLLEKTIIQIEKQIAKDIFSRFDNF